MKAIIRLIIILITIDILITGCDLFSTRTPETPNTSQSTYQPPVSANIAISNFINSITEGNTTNYIACLADTLQTDNIQFKFYPSSGAYALYKSIFDNWTIFSEQQYFTSLVSKMQQSTTPQLSLTNSQLSNMPDSVVYQSDYILYVNHTDDSKAKNFSGTIQLTLKQRSNGLWSIVNWVDIAPKSDSINNTWSNLKAIFIN